jgi:hypothetical protein
MSTHWVVRRHFGVTKEFVRRRDAAEPPAPFLRSHRSREPQLVRDHHEVVHGGPPPDKNAPRSSAHDLDAFVECFAGLSQ